MRQLVSPVVMAVSLMLGVTATGCRCGQTSSTTAYGEIRIISQQNGVDVGGEDGTSDFGPVPMGTKATIKVTVQNVGRGTLSLDSAPGKTTFRLELPL